MKKLLIVSLFLVIQNCYAAQESLLHHNNAMSFREKITKELHKPSAKCLLATGWLAAAGILLNNAVLPQQESIIHLLLTDAAIALPIFVGGYIVSAKTQPETYARFASVMKGGCVTLFGLYIQSNALHDCPLFTVKFHASKDSDDFYSYQCTHPTDDGDEPCGVACLYAEITSLVLLSCAGAALRQSMVHLAEERNQHELLPDQMNINNQEIRLLGDLETGFEGEFIIDEAI